MGWISDRAYERGGSINRNPRNNGSNKGPLRVIVGYVRRGRGMFDHDYVEFECGHQGSVTIGARRGRCRECKEEPKPQVKEKRK